MAVSAATLSFDDVSNISCNSCGMYDASLRYSEHPSVTSILIDATESRRVGIFCARCRGLASAKATAISLLLGWWSLQGPKLTIGAIRDNLKAGEQLPATNARLLRALAQKEFQDANPYFAAMFATAAQAAQPQRENARLIEELKRAGHVAPFKPSPWRFAALVPIVVLALVVVKVAWSGVAMLTAAKPETTEAAAAHRPLAVPARVAAATPSPAQLTDDEKAVLSRANADEVEKHLTASSTPAFARAYIRMRLQQWKGDVNGVLRRGESLMPMQVGVETIKNNAATATIANQQPLKGSLDNLTNVLNDAGRYYHGGAPAETLERAAGETLQVSANIELQALTADVHGNTERGDQLHDQVDQRLDSIDRMREDLRLRGALIGILTTALDRCLSSMTAY